MKVTSLLSLISLCYLPSVALAAVKGQNTRRAQGGDDRNQDKDSIATQNGRGGAATSGMTLGELYEETNNEEEGEGPPEEGGDTPEEPSPSPPAPPESNSFSSPSSTCDTKVFTDVVIIGAGMAGVAAAVTLQEQGVDYVVLESTDRVGGRIRGHSFGVQGNTWTIEDGAAWILDFNGNPILDLMEDNMLNAPLNDYEDFIIYGEDGQLLDPSIWEVEQEAFNEAWAAASGAAEESVLWTPESDTYNDLGVISLLAQQGWSIGNDQQGDLDYLFQWSTLDWEYAESNTALRYFPYYVNPAYMVADQRGYEIVPQQLFQTRANPTKLKISNRVTKINYNENHATYKAVVNTNTTQGCTDYIGKRVISTVSTGVINNGLIDFSPPLAYSASQSNPYYMAQYIKIYYQFDNQFWDDEEFIRVVRDLDHRGQCHQFQNLNPLMPGSNILRCELMTDAFETLIDPVTREMSEATMLELLDPLRLVYGAEVVGTPVDIYMPRTHKDADFGFGAYSNWKLGKTFTDFAQFFGAPQITPYCQHNGCNDRGEWIMHFAGAAVCYDQAETVQGAYWSGERSANYVLSELGFDVTTEDSRCDINWEFI